MAILQRTIERNYLEEIEKLKQLLIKKAIKMTNKMTEISDN